MIGEGLGGGRGAGWWGRGLGVGAGGRIRAVKGAVAPGMVAAMTVVITSVV